MATRWGCARRLGLILLALAAGATTRPNFAGLWALDSAQSDLGQWQNVETVMLRVECTPAHVTVLELVQDEFGGHVRRRELRAFQWARNTIQLSEQQPSPTPPEQWTLSTDGSLLSIRRHYGQSLQRLVFHRSTAVSE